MSARDPKPSKVGRRALGNALNFVGVSESPPGTNRGPIIDLWNEQAGVPKGTPWCLSFVRAMFRKGGVTLGGNALVQAFANWADQHGYLVSRPFAGDVVCYDWDGDGNWYDHVGIVQRVLAIRWRGGRFVGLIRAVEGNTSFGDNSNGGKVMIRTRWCGRCLFARIPDPS